MSQLTITINQLSAATTPLSTDTFPGQAAGGSSEPTLAYTPLQMLTAAISGMSTTDPHVFGIPWINGIVICVSQG